MFVSAFWAKAETHSNRKVMDNISLLEIILYILFIIFLVTVTF